MSPRASARSLAARAGAGMVAFSVGLVWASGGAAQTDDLATQGTQPGELAASTPPVNAAAECFSCHGGGVDDEGELYRPFDTWSGTMMANAARDPLFLAALTVAEQDEPGAGAYCLRCHSPQAFVKGNAIGTGEALDADDLEGVSCEGCHRSIDGSRAQPEVLHEGSSLGGLPVLDEGAPYIGNARLIWDSRDVRHGPHADAGSPAHAAASSSFGSSSEFCGQCHEVLSPTRTLRDADGTDTGFAFPLDTTYTEWRASDYARAGDGFRSCIDCHMQRATGSALTLATFPSALAREAPRTHLLVGGNEWSIEAVMQANPELVAERGPGFEAAKRATRELLSSAVSLEITAAAPSSGATGLNAVVRVENLTGHKFPTGYADGRRAFLQVELLDERDNRLAIVGDYDSDAHALVAHPDLRVWECIQAERLADDRHHEWHIVKNDVVLKDTRIPPRGFSPEPGRDARVTAPVLAEYGTVAPLSNYDEVRVHLTPSSPLSAGTLKLRARVYFQSTTKEFIDELELSNVTDDRGTTLREVWEATGHAAPRLIEEAITELEVAPAAANGGTGGGRNGADAGVSGSDAGRSSSGGAGAGATSPPPSKSDGGGCALRRPSPRTGSGVGAMLLLGAALLVSRLRAACAGHSGSRSAATSSIAARGSKPGSSGRSAASAGGMFSGCTTPTWIVRVGSSSRMKK